MNIIIQRVSEAEVALSGYESRSIGRGLVLLVGFEKSDTRETVSQMIEKVLSLRVFDDSNGKMNLSVCDITGELLAVPNFTLAASVQKGNRPSFDAALDPARARKMYEFFFHILQESGLRCQSGVFGAHMDVTIVNQGPVTFSLNSSLLKNIPSGD